MPQETIFFDHSALHRTTTVRLDPGASCLLLEAGILGRAAMGERVATLDLQDRREVWRGDIPVLVEPLQGARAFASLALVRQGAEAALAAVRRVLDEPGVTSGASALDGRVMVRLLAVDGWPMRRQILRLLDVLREAPVPRVWQI